jgi:hypothetical protein
MTLVMVWTDGSDRWWVVSDSRLSGTYNKLTDSAAKILEIPVNLYKQMGWEALEAPLKSKTLGFAYTGSSVVAFNAYAAVLPLWSRLENEPFNVLPSMEEFANHPCVFCQCLFQRGGTAMPMFFVRGGLSNRGTGSVGDNRKGRWAVRGPENREAGRHCHIWKWCKPRARMAKLSERQLRISAMATCADSFASSDYAER